MAPSNPQEILDKLTNVKTGSPYGATLFAKYLDKARDFSQQPSSANATDQFFLTGPPATIQNKQAPLGASSGPASIPYESGRFLLEPPSSTNYTPNIISMATTNKYLGTEGGQSATIKTALGAPFAGSSGPQYAGAQARGPCTAVDSELQATFKAPSNPMSIPAQAPIAGPSGLHNTNSALEVHTPTNRRPSFAVLAAAFGTPSSYTPMKTSLMDSRGSNRTTENIQVFFQMTDSDLQIAVTENPQAVLRYIFDLRESVERHQVALINERLEKEKVQDQLSVIHGKMQALLAAHLELANATKRCTDESYDAINHPKPAYSANILVPTCPDVLKCHSAERASEMLNTNFGFDQKGKGVHNHQGTPTKVTTSHGKTHFWGDSAGDFFMSRPQSCDLPSPLMPASRNKENETKVVVGFGSPNKFIDFKGLAATGLAERTSSQNNTRSIDSKTAQDDFMNYIKRSHLNKQEYRGTGAAEPPSSYPIGSWAVACDTAGKVERIQYSILQLLGARDACLQQGNPFSGVMDRDLDPVLHWKKSQKKNPFWYK